MKYTIRLSVLIWACSAPGCSSEPEPEQAPKLLSDPIGFTFKSTPGGFSSFGWTGAFHNVTQEPETPFAVTATECLDGLCKFEGPTDLGGTVQRRRCLANMRQVCTRDEDCPAAKGDTPQCVYIYDAPIPTPLQGNDSRVGACAWTYIPLSKPNKPSIKGVLDLRSGALNIDNLTLSLALNSDTNSNFRGICAECVGDRTPNDGAQDGVCQLATHKNKNDVADPTPDLNKRCDVHRTGRLDIYQANYSMDCSPSVEPPGPTPPPAEPLRRLPLGGSYSSSGRELTLSASNPNCSGDLCFCGTCENSATACMSDGECGNARCIAPATVHPNRCKDKRCNWNSDTGVGTCPSALPDGGTGPNIHCYPSDSTTKLVIPGSTVTDASLATTYRVETGGARCIPADPAADKLNQQVGLPGLLFQKRNFQIIPEYGKETE